MIIYKNEHYKSLSAAEEPEKTNNESFDCFSRVSSTEKKMWRHYILYRATKNKKKRLVVSIISMIQ